MNQNQVYLKISIAGAEERKVVIRLCTKECPKTCQNFLQLCSSDERAKRPSKHSSSSSSSSSSCPATYRNTEFHRIIPGFMVQGGDYQNFDGTGGGCVYNGGGTFKDESFDVKHDREGVLSMANKGPNTNGSQFFITLAKTPHLDGKHVAFGRVNQGMDVIKDMAKVETEKKSGKPIMLERVIITDCGIESPERKPEKIERSDENRKRDSITKKPKKEKNIKSKRKKEKVLDLKIRLTMNLVATLVCQVMKENHTNNVM